MAARRHGLLVGINEYEFFDDADLRGAVNDVERMAALLVDRFGFAEHDLVVLKNTEATRSGIIEAMERMVETVDRDDVVVFFYSGHGSRLRDPRMGAAPDRPAELIEMVEMVEMTETVKMIESIVPHDSGRGSDPNRDIVDEEIDRWVQRLNQKTPYVTLILDSCHSGSATRDVFGERVRRIEADTRSPEAMFAVDQRPRVFDQERPSATRSQASPIWIAGRRRAISIAACRKEEKASEVKRIGTQEILRYGALSDHLCAALLSLGNDSGTWRDIFERVAPGIQAEISTQHPQFEGSLDQTVFGVDEVKPAAYVQVLSAEGSLVRLAAGAAHGVSIGSRWSVRDHGAMHRSSGNEIATVEIAEVYPTTSLAKATHVAHPISEGQRAFVIDNLGAPTRLRLAFDVPPEQAELEAQLQRLADDSPLLERHDDAERAEVIVRLLPPRRSVDTDTPCPGLGPLDAWTWAAVGSDGMVTVRPRSGTDALGSLVADLESRSRYRNLLALDQVGEDSELRDTLAIEVLTWKADEHRFETAATDPLHGVPSLRPGETCDLVIRNKGSRPLWISLVEFGLDGKIALLMPRPGHSTFRLGSDESAVFGGTAGGYSGGSRIDSGQSLSVRDYYAQDPNFAEVVETGLPMSLPEGFPWSVETDRQADHGLLRIKAFVTTEPASFEFLEQNSVRSAGNHPLVQASHAAAFGRQGAVRSTDALGMAEIDWFAPVVTLGLYVED